ncbi:hypothetical protein NPIL_668521 [Nephila pilipes]|uniref:Uncharacterized protein n=1 Tax=Nephila pilipes TaxID=299642 RepID=A0A8X6NW99_NEPPI|nr:hypothetical protein NPIL_668521 [Nephila pilipes]
MNYSLVWKSKAAFTLSQTKRAREEDQVLKMIEGNAKPTLLDLEESSALNDNLSEQQGQELQDVILKFSKLFLNKSGET